MTELALDLEVSGSEVLLGDEAVSLGAIHAGITAAYAYPGTPSTEIFEYLFARGRQDGYVAHWCANEKTAYEQALGVSMMGLRAIVSMKHVGLNVAADPFINSALVDIRGGLVVAVADDPSMHSSQNEQDSRCLADFARIICLEPSSQQEAYDMTREAFSISEHFHIPVMLRLVTRLCHGRATVATREAARPHAVGRTTDPSSWILLPGNARRLWRELLDQQSDFNRFTEASAFNQLVVSDESPRLGVITSGIARNYYEENVADLAVAPSHLHVGAYPFPGRKIRELASRVETVLVIEEGYPFVERLLRGILPQAVEIRGKLSGQLPEDGELTPDSVRTALGLPDLPVVWKPSREVVARPPQLCRGCPHRDSYGAIKLALEGIPDALVAADIGCYTLGALAPYRAVESCVCMGASVGMAKGAADAGAKPVLAVIGDSTFLHSGVTALMDAVAADTDMTLLILDNETVGMTGAQPTILPDSRLKPLILGLGVAPEHCHLVEAHPRRSEQFAETIREEMQHEGLSVIIAVRECPESIRKRRAGHED